MSESAPRNNPIRRLYDWVLSLADTPYAVPSLFLLALAESSFFPIPPDVLLLALAIAKPERAFRFAAWCLAGSVIGGVIGYYLGLGLWSSVEPLLIPKVFSQAKFDTVTGWYQEYGVMMVFVAAFTPVPYKVFTIAAGVFELPLLPFIGASLIGRGARFFLVALVVRRYGDKAREFIDRHFNRLTIVFTLLVVAAILALKVL